MLLQNLATLQLYHNLLKIFPSSSFSLQRVKKETKPTTFLMVYHLIEYIVQIGFLELASPSLLLVIG